MVTKNPAHSRHLYRTLVLALVLLAGCSQPVPEQIAENPSAFPTETAVPDAAAVEPTLTPPRFAITASVPAADVAGEMKVAVAGTATLPPQPIAGEVTITSRCPSKPFH